MRGNNEKDKAVERLKNMIVDGEEEGFLAAIEKIQQGSFMDGYRYAIAILKESMVEKP